MADPSVDLCRIRDIFTDPPADPFVIEYYSTPPSSKPLVFTSDPFVIGDPNQFMDGNLYTQFIAIQRLAMEDEPAKLPAASREFLQKDARARANPFEHVGKSLGLQRTFVKMANLDVITNLCGGEYYIGQVQSERKLLFCDIAGGPGGFTQYIQWRYPQSQGYGISLVHPGNNGLNWNSKVIDESRFLALQNTGDIFTEYEMFIQGVLDQQPDGVDVVIADGGFDVTNWALEEEEHYRLITTECWMALLVCGVDGSIAVKIKHTHTLFMAQLLYLLSLNFTEIAIVKPVMARPANSERYLVCHGRLPTTIDGPIRDYVRTAAGSQFRPKTSLFREPLDEGFISWLHDDNIQSLQEQIDGLRLLIRCLLDQTLDFGRGFTANQRARYVAEEKAAYTETRKQEYINTQLELGITPRLDNFRVDPLELDSIIDNKVGMGYNMERFLLQLAIPERAHGLGRNM